MTYVILEGVRVLLLSGLLAYLWRVGRAGLAAGRAGWLAIIGGFTLLLLGSGVDLVSDLVKNDMTEAESLGDIVLTLVSQVGGFLGGLSLLIWGVARWLPFVRALSAAASAKDAALVETEQRLAAIAENLPGIIYRRIRHADGRIELPYIGGNLRELLGCEPAEVMGSPHVLVDCIHPDDRDLFLSHGDTAREQVPMTVELRARGRDGRQHWLRCSFRLFRRGDDAVVWDGLLLDVTSQKRAQLRAAQAEARLLDALESIDDGFAIYDADDRLAVCNSHYRVCISSKVAVEIGSRFEDIVRRGMAADAYLDAIGRNEEFLAYRLAVHRRQAEPIEVQVAGGRWRRISERATSDGGMVTVVADITSQKERERQLADDTARLAVTIAHMADGVVMFDADLRLLVGNDRYRELLALPTDLAAPGVGFDRILRFQAERGDFGAGDAETQVRQRLALAQPTRAFMVDWTRLDGHVIEMRGNPMPGGGQVVTCTDITAHKRAEEAMRAAKEAAEEATRAKSDFLANMSHELRTPLNAIIGFADVMKVEMFGPLGDRYHDYVGTILDSGRHLLALINDILDLSKVEAGKLELYEEPVDLVAAVEACLPMVAPRAELSGCRVEAHMPGDLPAITGDGRRVKQVLLNLLTNAVKFSGPGGHVLVRAWRAEGGGVELAVSDSGIGIAAEDMPRVLENWGQAHGDRTRAGEGAGLGLPLSKRLMELHGGALRLDSAPGVGTTVTLWFPPSRVLAGGPDVSAAS